MGGGGSMEGGRKETRDYGMTGLLGEWFNQGFRV